SYLATPGAQQVTVYNPSPGGGVSAASAFTVLGGPPVLTSLSPASTTAGAAGFTLTCNGSAFQAGSVVRWNGADLSTTFVSAAHLTATVTAAHVAAGGLQAVTVHTPGASGGTSAALNFSVNSAFPTLASVAPNSGTAGAASVALVATGTGFNPASKVRWNGVDLPTGFTSASQLTATVGAAQLATAGAATVTIFNPFPGGGTSFGQTFTVNNPAPAITSLTPASAPQNGGPTTITVNGSGFVTTSQVKRNSQNLATTFVSATQLTATITAPMTNSQGTSTITVVNGAPGGGTSAGATFTVTAPAPTLASLAPSSAIALSGATVVTATGTGFQTDVVLRWNGVDLPTTYVGPTQATATIPATQLTGPTTASIVARNVGDGWSSAPQTFTVHPAAPTLLFVAPWQVAAGAPTQTLSAAGSQYVPSSQILWNGAALATTYAGPGQLNAVVPASLLATGVAANVVVFTPPPGGGTSSPMVVNVLNPAPTLTSVAPASMSTSLINGSLTLNGAGFVPGSVAQWNGAPLATTYVGPTQLTAVLPAALLASGGIASATVSNPAPGGGVSAPAVVTVNNPMPVVLGLAPSQLTAGDVATTLSASGFNFNPSTVLRWNGTPLSTTLVSAFSVHATVPASFLAQPGTASVTAHNPAPGGGTSAPAVASVLAPSLTSVSPAVIAPMAYGAPPLSLTLTGARLLPGAEVWGDGVLLTSTSLGATQIQCELPSTLEQARRDGGLALVVRNGGVALSNALALTVGGGANLGVQITDPPTRDLAGQTFAFRIEAVPPGMPFTVFADLAATPFTTGFPTPAVGLVLGVGGPVTTPLVDGVGLFGPPAGVVFGAGPAGATPPGGVFVAPGLLAPAAPAADLTLQTLYVDPTSPLGWRLTWATSPRPF
ncbi:MAG TPA: hypothetical protein VEI02_15265, partial [Planctomycetota bacterium]|nr:hypothetical protein [Planctomycetota bacterium]